MNPGVLTRPSGATYIGDLLAAQPRLPDSPLAWLNDLRAAAVERVGELTVPTTRDEDWRFTDLTLLTQMSFHPVHEAISVQSADVEKFYIAEASTRLVFVDGAYAPQLSVVAAEAAGMVSHLSGAAAAAIEPHLARHVEPGSNIFAALNTAFLRDAALIVIPRDRAISAPVQLLFVATQKDSASYPRCLIVAESGSAVTVIEDYVSLQQEPYFTNSVTEVVLGEQAHVHHVRVQREGAQAFHIANCAVALARGSHYRSVSVALGARISRLDLKVLHDAPGAECAVDGLALITDRQLADTHSCIVHAQPHGVSRQLHKCIVGGSAHAVFNGKVMVRPGAQRINSDQSNRNLLLTGKAHIDTKPQLEIFADDVKCTHGATVGQLDSEEVFYLQSRGLSESAARNMLTYAFGAEIIERIPVPSLRHQLEQSVLAQTASPS
jgi:Fe-S cluster assembly protein SufD